ncbi:hypothetical protein [Stenotrophomonas maltophilia]|uniref:hypothetical protein n=1 Tax=Stenotrophomonas maltophilia TaxID=40324 RepID=UPI003D067C08
MGQAGGGSTAGRGRAGLGFAAFVGFLQVSVELLLPKQARVDFEGYFEDLIETLIPR